jgi:hypothetical protein
MPNSTLGRSSSASSSAPSSRIVRTAYEGGIDSVNFGSNIIGEGEVLHRGISSSPLSPLSLEDAPMLLSLTTKSKSNLHNGSSGSGVVGVGGVNI